MDYVIEPRAERTQPARIVPGYPQTPWRNPREPLVQRTPTLSELTGPAEVARRVLMRILKTTTLYFPGERANDDDPVLAAVPAARRQLLVAREEAPGRYRFDLKLRGEHETPFFDD